MPTREEINNKHKQDIIIAFKDRECEIINEVINKQTPIKYKCKCGREKNTLYKDFIRRNCRWCNHKELTIKNNDDIIIGDEIFKPIIGGYISNFGNAMNNNKKKLKMCSIKNRYHINGKNQYVAVLMATAFKIKGYEKLNGNNSSYVASYKDGNKNNIKLDNIHIIQKGLNKTKYLCKNRELQSINNIEYKKLDFLSDYKIYKNGEICNFRQQEFSLNQGYYKLNVGKKRYQVHRLICFAFNPLPDLINFQDYKHLQVNHKDGNTTNNNADNLEWVSASDNIKHAHSTNLIKISIKVKQYDLKTNELLGEFKSIAEASRQTGEPEHRIRSPNSKNLFNWERIK